MVSQKRYTIRIVSKKIDGLGEEEKVVMVDRGVNLRRLLLREGMSPYAPIPQRLNCGSRGACATCGGWIDEGEQLPTHWHDKIGNRFGYPRLSCQVTIENDMTVRLIPEKWIWGRRKPKRQSNSNLKSG
ncbi:MAG TPA: 2Fe-2S iron-sulfur cluster-binding protein [Aggregatilineales bacterium]|nr:2Fe-2S iron-sulfur cluster-binding protein [Aggregatilineales bacterium]